MPVPQVTFCVCLAQITVMGDWALKLIIVIIIDRFYIALFSALEQTHYASHVLVHAGLF